MKQFLYLIFGLTLPSFLQAMTACTSLDVQKAFLNVSLRDTPQTPSSSEKNGRDHEFPGARTTLSERGHTIISAESSTELALRATEALALKDLFMAAKLGRYKKVDELLAQGTLNLNAPDENGNFPLHVLCMLGDEKIVRKLFEYVPHNPAHAINPNQRSKEGVMPLDLMCGLKQGSSSDIAQLLIEQGVEVNRLDPVSGGSLHCAALTGNLPLVKLLVKKGAVVNARTASGITPLHLAAKEGHLHVVMFLLEHGADATLSTNDEDISPLHIACRARRESVVSYLCSYDPTLMESRSRMVPHRLFTSLHVAVLSGYDDIVAVLLNKGANVDGRGDENFTPLHVMCSLTELQDSPDFASYTKILRMLIKYGADLHAQTATGHTPLAAARHVKNDSFVDILKEALSTAESCTVCKKMTIPVQCPECFKVSYCSQACQKKGGHHAECQHESSGACSSTSNRQENSSRAHVIFDGSDPKALFMATKLNNGAMVKYLLAEGTYNVNVVDEKENTPLHLASFLGFEAIVRLLLDYDPLNPHYGVDLSLKNKEGATAFSLAMRRNQFGCGRRLVEKMIELSQELSEARMTPLHCAAEIGNGDFVNFLVSQGVALNARTREGETALYCAVDKGNADVVDVLLRLHADHHIGLDDSTFLPFLRACEKGNVRIVERFLEHDSTQITAVFNGASAVHLAVSSKNSAVISLLSSWGASLNSRDLTGRTPLHCACLYGNESAMRTLISLGAYLSAKTPQGETALALVRNRNYASLIGLLEEAVLKEVD